MATVDLNARVTYIRIPFLGGRLTVRLRTLDPPIGVRIPASQPIPARWLRTLTNFSSAAKSFSLQLIYGVDYSSQLLEVAAKEFVSIVWFEAGVSALADFK